MSDEIAVVDEELIQSALLENFQSNSDGATSNNPSSGLVAMVSEATTLRLSFKNIMRIANLTGFENLTTLCLDNNVVDKICNMDHLVNLKWLDLSFNNISKIEGLDNLTKLMDVSLFNNKILQIGGLDNCMESLQCLSLGNNVISSLDGKLQGEVGLCHYLRKFKKLHLVNLEGNPVCKEAEYKYMLLAYLPNVKYLDYALIQESEVATAREQYQDELQEEEENEALLEEKAKRDADALELSNILESANLAVVQSLFNSFFANDEEYAKLQHLPSINEHVDSLRNSIDQASETFKLAGLQLEELKKVEVVKFEACLKDMRATDALVSIKMIDEFNRDKKKIFKQIDECENDEDVSVPLKNKLDELYEKLMDLEIQQRQQFEEFLSEFENVFGELRNQCLDVQGNYFRAVEEAEENYFASLTLLANELLEKAGKDELPEDMSDEAASLLVDRDSLINCVASSHDIHVSKLFSSEELTGSKERTKFMVMVSTYTDDAQRRNRSRVMELYNFVQDSKKEIFTRMNDSVVEDDEYNEQ